MNNAAGDALELTVPTMKIISVGEHTGAEVEVVPGMQLEEASRVAPRFVDEYLSFPLGARIEIDAERFNHISLSNWVFGSNLAKRVETLLRDEGNLDFSYTYRTLCSLKLQWPGQCPQHSRVSDLLCICDLVHAS